MDWYRDLSSMEQLALCVYFGVAIMLLLERCFGAVSRLGKLLVGLVSTFGLLIIALPVIVVWRISRSTLRRKIGKFLHRYLVDDDPYDEHPPRLPKGVVLRVDEPAHVTATVKVSEPGASTDTADWIACGPRLNSPCPEEGVLDCFLAGGFEQSEVKYNTILAHLDSCDHCLAIMLVRAQRRRHGWS